MTSLNTRLVVVALVCSVFLAGCDLPFGAESGSTTQGRDILHLWQLMVSIALVILALVLGLVVWCVVRYRRRAGRMPSQRQYVIPIEVVYTVVPILIVATVFAFSWKTENNVDALSRNPAVVVDVTAFQWQWQFAYPAEKFTVSGLPDVRPTMVVPVDETVQINLRSLDVIHSMYVPEFLFKRDAIPGVLNRFDFTPNKTGHFIGRCAEFCGLDHARMIFYIDVVTRPEYDRWVQQQQAGATP